MLYFPLGGTHNILTLDKMAGQVKAEVEEMKMVVETKLKAVQIMSNTVKKHRGEVHAQFMSSLTLLRTVRDEHVRTCFKQSV